MTDGPAFLMHSSDWRVVLLPLTPYVLFSVICRTTEISRSYACRILSSCNRLIGRDFRNGYSGGRVFGRGLGGGCHLQTSGAHNRPDKNLQEESKASGWSRFFSNLQCLPPDWVVNLDELADSLAVEREGQSDAYKRQGQFKAPTRWTS